MKDAELLVHVEDEFRRGRIHERHLVADGWHLDGLQEGADVFVDPAPNVVESLIHEILHRRFPRWGEKRVSNTAHRLLKNMDSRTVRSWYRRYQRVAKKCKRPYVVDEIE